MESSSLYKELESFWLFYKNERFSLAAKEITGLLLRTMIAIYLEVKSEVSPDLRHEFDSREKAILGDSELRKANLVKLVKLFEEFRILDLAEGSQPERDLLKIYNLSELAHLSENSLTDRDTNNLKMCIFVLSEYVSALLRFKGWITSSYTSNIVERKFTLDRNTGIMVNPVDLSRNVSFKAATFGVMLAHICSQVVAEFLPRQSTGDAWTDSHQLERDVGAILFQSGYDAGVNFGAAISAAFEREDPSMSLHDRVKTWCWFDTSVGWGKFEDNLVIREPTDISGKITLRSNFLIAEKEQKDFNICGLMTGYIAGVLERLLGFSVRVKHDKHSGDCGQFIMGKDACDFFISRPTHQEEKR